MTKTPRMTSRLAALEQALFEQRTEIEALETENRRIAQVAAKPQVQLMVDPELQRQLDEAEARRERARQNLKGGE